MTSQTIITESSKSAFIQKTVPERSGDSAKSRLFETVKHLYTSDHQAEYLEINAQVELLLDQLQAETQKRALIAEHHQ